MIKILDQALVAKKREKILDRLAAKKERQNYKIQFLKILDQALAAKNYKKIIKTKDKNPRPGTGCACCGKEAACCQAI